MNHIGDTRPATLSMNKVTTEYWNSYTNWNSFINILYFIILRSSKYRNPWNKTEASFIKENFMIFRLVWLITSQCNAWNIHTSRCIVSAAHTLN